MKILVLPVENKEKEKALSQNAIVNMLQFFSPPM